MEMLVYYQVLEKQNKSDYQQKFLMKWKVTEISPGKTDEMLTIYVPNFVNYLRSKLCEENIIIKSDGWLAL
jgi:hypothetical protein